MNRLESDKPASHGERYYSIDLLRILSMFMIVCLHSMSHGGMYEISNGLGGVNFCSVWFHLEESICILGVDVFVLISGYFLVNQQFRLSKLFKIIVQTLFYSWIIICTLVVIQGYQNFAPRILVSALMPISYNEYWFVSAYVGMYILSPILNLFVQNIVQKQHLCVIIVLVGYFSIWNTLIPYSEPMGINRLGQSVAWFATLYLIGAYIRFCINKFSKIHLIFILSITCLFFSWLFLLLVSELFGFHLGSAITDYWYHYSSLPVLVASVSLFIWFKSISIDSYLVKRIVKIIAPLCFGVYLIHDNPNMRVIIWNNLKNMTDYTMALPIVSILYAVVVFMVCLLIDFFRSILFRSINQRGWYKSMLSKMDKKVVVYFDFVSNTILDNTKYDGNHK